MMKELSKVCILTNGCPENCNDSARLQNYLEFNNWPVISDYKEADIIIFNACGKDATIEMVKAIKDTKKASAELLISGCAPLNNKDKLNQVFQGMAFGEADIDKIHSIFKPEKVEMQDISANHLLPSINISKKRGLARKLTKVDISQLIPTGIMKIQRKLLAEKYLQMERSITVLDDNTFYVKVSTGCLCKCSYCGIRFSRGKLKSKPMERIMSEVDEGIGKGFREFGLIGTDIGSYGRDMGVNLASLLNELVGMKEVDKVKLRNVHPKFLIEMLPEMIKIFKTKKIPYIESAVQSGNNRILRLMKRGYRIEDYQEAIQRIKHEMPAMQVRTQIIVAFPSETETEFQDSVRLLDKVEFDFVEVYQFKPRPNTVAEKMNEQIPERIARRRRHELWMKSVSILK